MIVAGEPAITVHHQDTVSRRLKRSAKQRERLFELHLHLLVFGDVLLYRKKMSCFPTLIQDRRYGRRFPVQLAVLFLVLKFTTPLVAR